MTYLRQLNQTNPRGRVCGTPKVGVLGATVPRTGTNGAAPLVTAFGLTSADDATEVLAVIEAVGYTGTLHMDETSAFDYTGANGSVTLGGYRGITYLGSSVIALNADGSSSTLVYADLAATYAIGALVSADMVADYAIASLVHADLVATYSVGALVYADMHGSYSIGDSIPVDLPESRLYCVPAERRIFSESPRGYNVTIETYFVKDGRPTIYKTPAAKLNYGYDLKDWLAEIGADLADVSAEVVGVAKTHEAKIQGTCVYVNLEGLDESEGATNSCTFKFTADDPDASYDERTIYFIKRR